MPSRLYPMTSCWNNIFIVKLESYHCRPPHACQTHNYRTIITPTKMFTPFLFSGVK